MSSLTSASFAGQPSTADSPDHRSATRRRWLAATAIALQVLGYLLVWVTSHAIGGMGRASVSSENPVSTGWYDRDSSYADWVYDQPLVVRLVDSRAMHVLGLGGGLTAAAAGYVMALVLARRAVFRGDLRRLLIGTLLIATPLLLLPQIFSSDVWSYAFYGRIPVVHHGNPFVDLPSAYPDDSLLRRLYWKSTASVYGPVWVGVSVALAAIAQLLGGAAWAYLVTFKSFLFVCHLANVAIIYRILRRIRPGTETWGSIFYAWNPLVLFEFAGNCHNDVFMITLILIAVACAAAGRPNLTAAWLTAAGLAKLTGLLGLPVYALYIARQSPRPAVAIAKMIAISLSVIVVLYAPFWHGMATFHGTADAPNFRILYRSPAAAAANLLERTLDHVPVTNQWIGEQPPAGSHAAIIRDTVRKSCLAAFSICFLALTIWPVRSFTAWVERVIWIYVAYIVLAALYFNPWYGTWLIPLAALIRRPWPVLVGASLFFLLFYLPVQPTTSHAVFLYWPWPLLAAAAWRVWEFRWDRHVGQFDTATLPA